MAKKINKIDRPGCTSAQKNNNKWSINTVIAYFVSRLNYPKQTKKLNINIKSAEFFIALQCALICFKLFELSSTIGDMTTTQDKARTIQKLEDILDSLCRLTDRNITIIYPENKNEIIPYLKKRDN